MMIVLSAGMSNLYRDVQSVVVRARGAGAAALSGALLLNCHFDTVPDSPGEYSTSLELAALIPKYCPPFKAIIL